jgi:pimeloyl-ACP methyl ester carboxylesterase
MILHAAMKSAVPPRTIVFAHANSFPASTYRLLFDGWRAAGYEVHALDKFGHDPRYPVSMNWPHLVAQLKDFIEREVRHPAYLIGHSLGGFLSMMAASRHPHLAQGVIVMDSPVLHGWKSAGIGLAKRMGTMERVMTPARIAAERTHLWPSLQAVHAHFSAKPKFAAFHPEVLSDYLRHGTLAHADGPSRRLSFERDIEAAIYKTMPHGLVQEFRRHPHRCPVAFIGGTHSRETRRVGIEGIRLIVGQRMSWINGTHLYPFEDPDATVAEVLKWLESFRADSARADATSHPSPVPPITAD